ncbi:hypothetical protein ABFU65_02510 [Xanthomonas campestris pv. raphani]|uniref:hypothetical protein n=1 Tax=Xanthomonas campestris TaxID=339 RepID=UPI002AD2EB32|nr:hypothetical protein [Xanthomonas campestris]MEA0736795.1 hypothetical protein [Xanthomonas campestris pv. campestris]MEA9620219.1 hypothetical protein [Xanthomonas campestris pv. incanae]MEA9655433.1 hypothetical protein [Xanthomonas campestris pv. raphani]MEA9897547.1 hypothetical protein [Xanthomonas campestris pv. raphani]
MSQRTALRRSAALTEFVSGECKIFTVSDQKLILKNWHAAMHSPRPVVMTRGFAGTFIVDGVSLFGT